MKFKFEEFRINLTRIAGAIVLFLFFSAQSYWERHNIVISYILLFLGIFFVAIASLGRMWCSLYIAGYKDSKLITVGPYSLCRNPLYFFSMIGVIGIGCATKTFTFPILFIILFSSYYRFVIISEEARLKQLFGAEFEEYEKTVPAFFPRFSNFSEPDNYNVKPSVYRNHIFSAIWFIWIIGIIEVIERMKEVWFLSALWTFY
jgi:protein-S-isoprenylcysteine O-methyltransferase Ste14